MYQFEAQFDILFEKRQGIADLAQEFRIIIAQLKSLAGERDGGSGVVGMIRLIGRVNPKRSAPGFQAISRCEIRSNLACTGKQRERPVDTRCSLGVDYFGIIWA